MEGFSVDEKVTNVAYKGLFPVIFERLKSVYNKKKNPPESRQC